MVDIESLKDSLVRREEGPDRRPLWSVPKQHAADMAAAADVVDACVAELRAANSDVVAEVLRDQRPFAEWNHYPKGDVYDRVSHAQYYYHAHPSDLRGGEHGHFHTFLRMKGMPKGMKPAPMPASVERPLGADALAHIVGISMDKTGRAIQLFTVNRWVTGETWYKAKDVIALVERFAIDHAVPSGPTNRWVGAMLQLFRPQVEWLLRERDEAVRMWQLGNRDEIVYEDRKLEVASVLDISVESQIRLVREAQG